jgi:hypothetical protein
MKSPKLLLPKAAMLMTAVISVVIWLSCSLVKNQSIPGTTFPVEEPNNIVNYAAKRSSPASVMLAGSNEKQQVKQMIYGPTVRTRSYHNSECIYCNNDPNAHTCIDRWCFGIYELTVSAPAGWYFTGEPQLNCVEDNDGAFNWNLGYTNHKVILQRDPKFIKIRYFIGSRSIQVNLKCEATKE